ncbi:MAG: prohibitin family protein [Candidatus Viridilinea halotolerans]|uniref:Prohibitin family protein n=1 Tax=Candidatus Viridilinea halotolerans TaxID=2491704 RepID=A0A426TRX6_9CHLR|nr:MAG: prohibitin family protein [Candidatus Viridilinea halotolerans]
MMQPQRGLPYGVLTSGIIIVMLIVFALSNATAVVETGTRGVVKTFGQVTGVFGEGLHFRLPFVTNVVIIDIKTQRMVSSSSAASRDLQIVTTQVVLNYRADPEKVGELVTTIGVNYESIIIDPAIQESVKAATAQFTAENLITQRPLVSESIREVLLERLAPRGIIVEDVSITEFNFSDEFSRAIEAKQVAEQDALRAERELRRAQIEAQQQVARAQAEAEANLEVARAEAEALRLQREVISPELLQLRFIERWDGVLPRFMTGDTGLLPLINIPAGELEEAASAAPTAAPPAPAPAPAPEPQPQEP